MGRGLSAALARLAALALLAGGCGYSGSSPQQEHAAQYEERKVDPAWRPYASVLGLQPGASERVVVAALGEPSTRRAFAAGTSALQWDLAGEPQAAVTAIVGPGGLQAVGITGEAAVAAMKARGLGGAAVQLVGQPLDAALQTLPPATTMGERAARVTTPPEHPAIRIDLRADGTGKVVHVGLSWGAVG